MASVIVCDRCDRPAGLGHTQLHVLAGDLADLMRDGPLIDLCRSCAGELLVWLESKPTRTPARRTASHAH